MNFIFRVVTVRNNSRSRLYYMNYHAIAAQDSDAAATKFLRSVPREEKTQYFVSLKGEQMLMLNNIAYTTWMPRTRHESFMKYLEEAGYVEF